MKRYRLPMCLLIGAFVACGVFAAAVSSMQATALTTTNQTRYTALPVGQILWIDARTILPAASTVTVYRVFGSGTDTVATVVCENGLGRGAPNTNTWYALINEYFQAGGYTSGVVRVITSGTPQP